MNELDRTVLTAGYALHVHKARGVGAGNVLGAGGLMAIQLVAAHAGRHVGLLYGEHATKAAAGL